MKYALGQRVDAVHHYALLHYVLTRHKPAGVALEFGVGSGQSTRLIAGHMPVVGFDSFKGLPEDWREGFPAGMFAQHTIPDIPNTQLVVGLFEDTLPGFTPPARIGLVHIDCDLYSSTKTVLTHIRLHLKRGTIIVFDEWHGYEGCEQHEQRAWRELCGDLDWQVLGHSHQQWSIRLA